MFQGWQDFFFIWCWLVVSHNILLYDVANKSASHAVHNVHVSVGSPAVSDTVMHFFVAQKSPPVSDTAVGVSGVLQLSREGETAKRAAEMCRLWICWLCSYRTMLKNISKLMLLVTLCTSSLPELLFYMQTTHWFLLKLMAFKML